MNTPVSPRGGSDELLSIGGLRIREQVAGGARFFDASVVQHDNPIGELLYNAQIVRHDDHRHMRLTPPDFRQRVQDLDTTRHVDRAHRLIGKHDSGLCDHRPRDGNPLRLST